MNKIFQLSNQQQAELLTLARKSISHGLRTGTPLTVNINNYDSPLSTYGASFVTLTINSALRGCIGSLEARLPLVKDVCENAFASAFHDPRFPPLASAEFDSIHIEISVLSPLEEMSFTSQEDLLEQIEPFRDGLLLENNDHRGTFLPLVWEQLPDKHAFLSHLKQKAGLPTNYWSRTLRCYRYHTLVFEEQ